MFKGAAVKVFQHTHLPFYVILCNCEVKSRKVKCQSPKFKRNPKSKHQKSLMRIAQQGEQ